MKTIVRMAGSVVALVPFLLASAVPAQVPHRHVSPGEGRELTFPDIPGYKTLKVDLHMHTVFSDGSVWPDIRVEEAVKDGLDAISLTEHLSYQPHRADIPHPDRNRAHEVAAEFLSEWLESEAKKPAEKRQNLDLILVRGSEITRRMPPGHANAVFVTDSNALLTDYAKKMYDPEAPKPSEEEAIADSIEAFRAAKKQGAFVFWNHPHWVGQQSDGVATLSPTHRQLIDEGLLHGIEVINDWTYSAEALEIALENDLTILGTSDVHGLVDWRYQIAEGGRRPISLAFARERSADGLKTALVEGSTLAWANNILVGKEEFAVPLIEASLEVESATYDGNKTVLELAITNKSSSSWVLENKTDYTLRNLMEMVLLEPQSTTVVDVRTLEHLESVDLQFEVLNAHIGGGKHPTVTLRVNGIQVVE